MASLAFLPLGTPSVNIIELDAVESGIVSQGMFGAGCESLLARAAVRGRILGISLPGLEVQRDEQLDMDVQWWKPAVSGASRRERCAARRATTPAPN